MSLERLKAKVGELIEKAQSGGDDFIGIKYSNYDSVTYGRPKTADARSLDNILREPSTLSATKRNEENNTCLLYAFANLNQYEGYFLKLEEVYLPRKLSAFKNTFLYCSRLTTIHGDLSNIDYIQGGFNYCTKLDINALLARMPNLKTLEGTCFGNCTQLTELHLSANIEKMSSNSFSNCTNVTDVYCPWAEGAVANAPWGMKNAQIHYNYNAEV